jgi:hypothetical protein
MIFPVNYRYRDGAIVFLTNRSTKLAGADYAKVAFEIDGVHPDGQSGWSVVVLGRAYEITDALDADSQNLRVAGVPSAIRDGADAVVGIAVDCITGRKIGFNPHPAIFSPLDPILVTWPPPMRAPAVR